MNMDWTVVIENEDGVFSVYGAFDSGDEAAEASEESSNICHDIEEEGFEVYFQPVIPLANLDQLDDVDEADTQSPADEDDQDDAEAVASAAITYALALRSRCGKRWPELVRRLTQDARALPAGLVPLRSPDHQGLWALQRPHQWWGYFGWKADAARAAALLDDFDPLEEGSTEVAYINNAAYFHALNDGEDDAPAPVLLHRFDVADVVLSD